MKKLKKKKKKREEKIKEETKGEEKKIEEKSRKQKRRKEEKIDCMKERAYILQTIYQKNLFKNTLNFKINVIVKFIYF